MNGGRGKLEEGSVSADVSHSQAQYSLILLGRESCHSTLDQSPRQGLPTQSSALGTSDGKGPGDGRAFNSIHRHGGKSREQAGRYHHHTGRRVSMGASSQSAGWFWVLAAARREAGPAVQRQGGVPTHANMVWHEERGGERRDTTKGTRAAGFTWWHPSSPAGDRPGGVPSARCLRPPPPRRLHVHAVPRGALPGPPPAPAALPPAPSPWRWTPGGPEGWWPQQHYWLPQVGAAARRAGGVTPPGGRARRPRAGQPRQRACRSWAGG